MSGVSNTVTAQNRSDMAARSPRKFLGFDVTLDWLMRPLFGFALAAIAIAATYYGGFWFAAFIAVGASAAAREWHRMWSGAGYFWFAAVSIAAIVISTAGEVLVAKSGNPQLFGIPWLILVGAILLNFALAFTRGRTMFWHAASMVYIGVPALCLVAIREVPANGVWELFALFFAVWLTDTGALVTGNLLKGPKLWPALSPNKTWSGSIGGAIAGALGGAGVFLSLQSSPWHGAALGLAASAIGQLGDLFESFLKRKVGRKNSGSLIPGHGGVLDRIDSMLFVAPVAALMFLIFNVDPFALGLP
ncbi:MAG: phosphatidate cytidylyltransferase [Proteobacteria bacterium]|nr:phosphatidate cytidylyltransferase [Pseudomonadota bacterium]